MTRDEKLALHLEMVIWEDLPDGKKLNARQITELLNVASDDQRRRAYQRALVTAPLLLDDERLIVN